MGAEFRVITLTGYGVSAAGKTTRTAVTFNGRVIAEGKYDVALSGTVTFTVCAASDGRVIMADDADGDDFKEFASLAEFTDFVTSEEWYGSDHDDELATVGAAMARQAAAALGVPVVSPHQVNRPSAG